MTVNYARIESREAWLSTDFGLEFATRKFGQEAIDALPTYQRGKRIGLKKGMIRWKKVTRGGWVKTGPYCQDSGGCGYVETRVNRVIEAKLVIPTWGGGEDEDEVLATWTDDRV